MSRFALALLIVLPTFGLAPTTQPDQNQIKLLVVDADSTPEVEIRWENQDGDVTKLRGDRPYGADASREHLGGNIEAFVAVGGTRLTKGAGHPRGAIIRAGFYKADKAKPWFPDITKDTEITVTISGVRFNQPTTIRAGSVIQHLKYDKGDMESCGIPGDAREQFNTADPDDTLNDRVRPDIDTRLGAFSVIGPPNNDEAADANPDEDPDEDTDEDTDEDDARIAQSRGDELGHVRLTTDEHDSATVTLTFRYPALRNLRDPWRSDLPGTFLEPIHFHIEFEALPVGVEPLDPTRTRVIHPAAED